MSIVWPIVIGYLAIVLFLAFRLRGRTRTLDDYFVGGRSFSLWYNANTMAATAIGSGTTLGVAGLAFTQGISAGWILVGYAIGFSLIAVLIAKPLHRMKSVTLPDVIGERFGERARRLVAVLVLLQYFGIAAAQVLALGVLTSSMLDVSFATAVIVMGAVMTLYTAVGGLLSISLVDVFQMALMAVGIMVLLPFVGLQEVGGASGLQSLNSSYFDLGAGGVATIIGMLAWIIPQGFLSQELWIRVFAAESPAVAQRSTLIASLGVYLPYAVSVVVIGLCGAALYSDITPDAVIPHLIADLTPAPVQGVLYAALLSVLMSTATSVILVAGSNLVKDLCLPLVRTPQSDRTQLIASKVAVVIVGGLSIALALSADGIIELLQNVATPYVGALTPIVLAAFFWKRATSTAAVATMVVSIVLSAALYLSEWTVWELHPIVLNLLACSVTLVAISLLPPGQPDRRTPALAEKV